MSGGCGRGRDYQYTHCRNDEVVVNRDDDEFEGTSQCRVERCMLNPGGPNGGVASESMSESWR